MNETRAATAADPAGSPRPGPVAWVLLLPIKFSRKVISPFFPPACRFYPSCSAYAVEALTRHGAARGTYLAVRRLLRCGPWTPPGRDPVPEVFSWRHTPRPDTSIEE